MGRLIPAHAGKTVSVIEMIRPMGAHPRSRGENCLASLALSQVAGSSPLTRGKQRLRPMPSPYLGLIPAHAGKTHRMKSVAASLMGSSPLTRGKHQRG